MSVKNEQTEILEEGVVEFDATENLEKEAKKAKVVKVAKKVGKVAAIAGVGLLGYILGSKSSNQSSYDDSEIVYDVEQSDE